MRAFSAQLALEISDGVAPDLPALPEETELVVCRVAQEALINVARHSASSDVDFALEHGDGRLTLTIQDYGLGLPRTSSPAPGSGHAERAALMAQRSSRHPPLEVRVEVRLEVPFAG